MGGNGMALLNSLAAMQPELAAWRRQLHANPELDMDTHATAAFVAEKLTAFGCDAVVTGIGKTGVVGLIRGRLGAGPTVGLRADMDALPIVEETGAPYASSRKGVMHACGHDGHTAMLLGAARHLAETRHFAGTVAVIFQPGEEMSGGGKAMLEDGLMERFAIASVYGMHNMPGLAVGKFAIRSGAMMGSGDAFAIEITGKGGHAAHPHDTVDPIFIGAQIVSALQGIVSRNTDPLDSVVISITRFQAGDSANVIPQRALLWGTIRSLNTAQHLKARARVKATAEGIATALGGTAVVNPELEMLYPVTFNHPRETAVAIAAARDVAGEANVDTAVAPTLGTEDFSFMLEKRPGAYIFLGNGDSAFCHHPAYDFNDEAIAHGVSYWVRLAERVLAPHDHPGI
jgi:hippurate hydrolase